jgi:hypothetical protein
MEDKEKQPKVSSVVDGDKKKRTLNTFPRIPISKVLDLAKTIYELGEGDPVPRLVVFDKLGKSPESGPSRMLITTSNSYGLTTGSYVAERLGITELGKSIVSKDGSQRRDEIVRALLTNDLFSRFHEKYSAKGIPTEPIGEDYLKQVGSLSGADAKVAFSVFMENMKDHGFIRELSGRPTILPIGMMELKDEVKKNDEQTPKVEMAFIAENIKSEKTPKPDQTTPLVSPAIVPQFNFNIQVQIPDNSTAETYDAIFKSIADNLLKINSK